MTTIQQNTSEWLELRKSKIGASDAPVIMGVSPWKTPYELWEEKIGWKENGAPTNAMTYGQNMEEKARACFESKTGLIMAPEVAFHSKHDWMIASLDGIDLNRENIVEIKCANRDDHALAKQGKIPDKYYPQVQHQLEVTGLPMAYYFSYREDDGIIVEVGRDDSYIKQMLDEEKDFFVCMKDFIPPKLTERDYLEQDSEEWKSACKDWLEVQKSLNELVKFEEEIKKKLISLSSQRNSRGAGVRVCKMVRKGNINYASIPCLKGKNLELYRKPSTEYWRITSGD